VTVRGNHDRACVGQDDLEWFNPSARQSAVWTQAELSDENASWLRNLPKGPLAVDDFQILHGTPLDEDAYLLQEGEASMLLGYLEKRVTFFGHTHVQGGFCLFDRGVVQITPLEFEESERKYKLDPDCFYLLNPGSIGQPRDGDPRAAFAIYEPEKENVVFYRVPYPIAGAQQKILDAGLPPLLAHRLSVGR
jgi:diadenosine tetraphosphatase ApaH/serine/threonine PP2A family protein phosphatase